MGGGEGSFGRGTESGMGHRSLRGRDSAGSEPNPRQLESSQYRDKKSEKDTGALTKRDDEANPVGQRKPQAEAFELGLDSRITVYHGRQRQPLSEQRSRPMSRQQVRSSCRRCSHATV